MGMELGSFGEADGFCLQSVAGEIGFVWYFVLAGVGGQRTAVLMGRNWLRFVNDVCRVAGWAGEIEFVSRCFV